MLASKTTEVRYVRKVRFISYPAGKYDHGASYVCTDAAGPFVELDGQYYAMYIEGTWIGTEKGINPAQDYALNGTKAVWRLMDKYLALFAEMIFADYAKLGSAVCLGDYMFSQYGIRDSVVSNAYQNFDPDNLDSFRPNVFIDWLNGYFETNNCKIRGEVIATSGTFSGALKKSRTSIDQNNYLNYFTHKNSAYYLNIDKSGLNIHLDGILPFSVIVLPTATSYTDIDERELAREYVGNKALIYNHTNSNMAISGVNGMSSAFLRPHSVAILECDYINAESSADTQVQELIGWTIKYNKIQIEG